MRMTPRRWLRIEAAAYAVAGGCGALLALDEHAPWNRQVLAFLSVALPAFMIHARGEQATAAAK